MCFLARFARSTTTFQKFKTFGKFMIYGYFKKRRVLMQYYFEIQSSLFNFALELNQPHFSQSKDCNHARK